MSMSWIRAILLVIWALVVVESVIFTNSLMGATMQDGGKRERSDDQSSYIYYFYIKTIYYNFRLGSGCNLDKELSRNKELS